MSETEHKEIGGNNVPSENDRITKETIVKGLEHPESFFQALFLAFLEFYNRPSDEEYRAAVKKAQEKGVRNEKERNLKKMGDVMPHIIQIEDLASGIVNSGNLIRSHIGIIKDILRFESHKVDAKGLEYDGTIMEIVGVDPTDSAEAANTVSESYSDDYWTIEGDVIQKLLVNIFKKEVAE